MEDRITPGLYLEMTDIAVDDYVRDRVPEVLACRGARRATARIVAAPADNSNVRFGATVTILRDDGREQTFRIVGEDEADPAKGSISYISPLARAMLGKSVGDVVRAGNDQAEITSIR